MTAAFRASCPRLLVLLLSAAGAVAAESPRAITLSERLPFAEDAAGDVGITGGPGGMAKGIEERCDLQRAIPRAIAAAAARKHVTVVLSENPEAAAGPVLAITIEGVMGMRGGAWTGAKSLTLRGELRDGAAVLGSFVARAERTSLAKGICATLIDAGEELAAPIAKWLQKPVMKARLGEA